MAGSSQGGLDQVDQNRQGEHCAHDGERAAVEDVAIAKAVIHVERLLQATASLWSHSFYLYHRAADGEEQLSFAYA